jgi:hypothetical protein
MVHILIAVPALYRYNLFYSSFFPSLAYRTTAGAKSRNLKPTSRKMTGRISLRCVLRNYSEVVAARSDSIFGTARVHVTFCEKETCSVLSPLSWWSKESA